MATEQALKILDKLEEIMNKAADVAEYRALLQEAARAGDLDPAADRFEAANARAESFIQGDD